MFDIHHPPPIPVMREYAKCHDATSELRPRNSLTTYDCFHKSKFFKINWSSYVSKKSIVHNGYDYSLFNKHFKWLCPTYTTEQSLFLIACPSTLFSEEIQSLYTNVFMDLTAYQKIFLLCQLNLVKLSAISFYVCVSISFWTTWRKIQLSRRIVSNDQTYK